MTSLTMKFVRAMLAWSLPFAVGLGAHGAEIQFGGRVWSVRSGQGGPGPNRWDERNVWLDGQTNLHLRIAQREGAWSGAEVVLRERLGFGRYEFQVRGRLDQFDDNIVLGLFNYPTREVGPDGTHEIDIEFARWGDARNPIGNFTIWPVEAALRRGSKSFPVELTGEGTRHTFTWQKDQIVFRSGEEVPGAEEKEICRWVYAPQPASSYIAARPMPVHINLWLFQGKPPKNGREVEIVISKFTFEPE